MQIYRFCKFTRIVNLIIFSLIISLVVPFQTSFAEANENSNNPDPTPTSKQPRLLVVPLDDRPANTYYPKKVGQAGGVDIILPPQTLIHHQTSTNTLDQLSNWILENSADADGFIISADMLTDGGLVESRTNKQTVDTALQHLEIIKTLKEKYPTKPLYVYDTIQRLAPTVLQDGNLEKYNLIREWAITVDEVKNFNKTSLAPRLKQLEAKIGGNLINEYMQIRNRNNMINDTLLDWTKEGFIDYLILGQDDSNKTGLHREEQTSLLQKINTSSLQQKVNIFDGADELDVILLSRFLATQKHYQTSFKIHYLGVNGANWTSPFDYYPLQTNIERHIIAAGGTVALPYQQADIELYVNTPDSSKKNSKIQQAIADINNQIQNGKHVVFVDVEKINQANAQFGDAIINNIGITNLLSYSAFNTAGNAIGVAVGHANARFLYVEKGPETPELDETAAKGHIEFLLSSIAADHLYRSKVEPKLEWYVRYIGSNAWDIGPNKNSVLRVANEQFSKEFANLNQQIKGKNIILSKKVGNMKTAEMDHFSINKIDFPWNRLFEVDFDFNMNFTTNGGKEIVEAVEN